MRKYLIALILFIILSLTGCTGSIEHPNLDPNDISKITVCYINMDDEFAERNMSKDEMSLFLHYYNQCSSIRSNRGFAGTTVETYVVIYGNTESNDSQLIDSGEDFEIQTTVHGQYVSYWAKQTELDEYLFQIGVPGDGIFRA